MGEKHEKSSEKKIQTAVTVCFLCFLLLMSVMNFRLAARPAWGLLTGEFTFRQMTQEIADNYVSSKLWGRNAFINFNGLFARITQRHAYNETILMDNGMLNYGTDTFLTPPDETLPENLAAAVGELDEFLGAMDVPLYYVLAPVKEDLQGEMLPEPLHNYQNETGTRMLELLAGKGVTTLDLRPFVTGTAEDSEKYFYRTDHHWNGDGALVGFGVLMDWLREVNDPALDTTYTDAGLWERHTLENAFLGTHGKRVGTLYDGTDDLIWYEPTFETSMSMSVPDLNEYYTGSFSEVDIRERFRTRQDYFAVTPYVIYIGGDYPLVHHRNPDAPNQKKLLLIKDSFGLAVEAFLSTEYTAVDVIDPRYFTDAGIAEYCSWAKPDLVVILMSPSAIENRYYTRVGISAEDRSRLDGQTEHRIFEDLDLELGAGKEYTSILPFQPEDGKTYRITVEEITCTDPAEPAAILLLNRETGEIQQQRIFNLRYNGVTEPIQWTFTVPEREDETQEQIQDGASVLPQDEEQEGTFELVISSGLYVYDDGEEQQEQQEQQEHTEMHFSGIRVTELS